MTRFRIINHSHYINGQEKNGDMLDVQSLENDEIYVTVFDDDGNKIFKWVDNKIKQLKETRDKHERT